MVKTRVPTNLVYTRRFRKSLLHCSAPKETLVIDMAMKQSIFFFMIFFFIDLASVCCMRDK